MEGADADPSTFGQIVIYVFVFLAFSIGISLGGIMTYIRRRDSRDYS
ncbi:MAG: hypothetical protein V3S98_10380 [Dehalococcoidia bacterium]